MKWNYRVMEWEKDGERWRTIHEVYYDDDGALVSYVEDPAYPLAAADDEMHEELEKFAEALSHPTLVAEQFPSPPVSRGE